MTEIIVIDEVKIAEHNKFKCWHCGGRQGRGRIMKGLPVVRFARTGKFGYQTHSLCHRCGGLALKDEIKKLKDATTNSKKLDKELTKIMKGCTKALVLDKLSKKEEEW